MKIVHAIFLSLRFILCFILIECLVSCSLAPVKMPTQTTYLLQQTPHLKYYSKTRTSLLVLPPEVSAAYRNREMAYTTYPFQIAYFSKNRWAESPAQMLQPLMMESLQNTHYFRAVLSANYPAQFDYILKTQLLELQEDFTQHPVVYRIRMNAQLVSAGNTRVIATKRLVVEEPVRKNTPYSGVVAANRAVAKILQQLVVFCIQHH